MEQASPRKAGARDALSPPTAAPAPPRGLPPLRSVERYPCLLYLVWKAPFVDIALVIRSCGSCRAGAASL